MPRFLKPLRVMGNKEAKTNYFILSNTKNKTMKTFDLKGEIRTDFGKKAAKSLRKQNLVPCNLYGGKDLENVNFTVNYTDILKLIYTPDVYIVNLTIGDKEIKTILKETQFHPVTDDVIHMDFLRISEDVPVTMEIPVNLTGVAAGVKAGGRQYLEKRRLKVRGLYQHFPSTLDVDITHLELGDAVLVSELDFDNIEILNPQDAMVCRVQTTRIIFDPVLEEEEEEAEEAAEAAAEEAAGEEGDESTEAAAE